MDQICWMKFTGKNFTARSVVSFARFFGGAVWSGAIAAPVVADGVARNTLQSSPKPNRMFAQAGSTGGFVGKQGKSSSGAQDTGRPHRSERAHRSEGGTSHRREHRQSQPRATASFRYDGTWSGANTGSCIGQYGWTIHVLNGIMSGGGTAGHVSSGGAASGTMNVAGTVYSFSGRASSSQASGRWTRPDGCSGNWTASRS
jgi:hypothetical protein